MPPQRRRQLGACRPRPTPTRRRGPTAQTARRRRLSAFPWLLAPDPAPRLVISATARRRRRQRPSAGGAARGCFRWPVRRSGDRARGARHAAARAVCCRCWTAPPPVAAVAMPPPPGVREPDGDDPAAAVAARAGAVGPADPPALRAPPPPMRSAPLGMVAAARPRPRARRLRYRRRGVPTAGTTKRMSAGRASSARIISERPVMTLTRPLPENTLSPARRNAVAYTIAAAGL